MGVRAFGWWRTTRAKSLPRRARCSSPFTSTRWRPKESSRLRLSRSIRARRRRRFPIRSPSSSRARVHQLDPRLRRSSGTGRRPRSVRTCPASSRRWSARASGYCHRSRRGPGFGAASPWIAGASKGARRRGCGRTSAAHSMVGPRHASPWSRAERGPGRSCRSPRGSASRCRLASGAGRCSQSRAASTRRGRSARDGARSRSALRCSSDRGIGWACGLVSTRRPP